MHDMTSSADWTGVRPVTDKMSAAVLACGEQIEMKSPAETKMASRKLRQGRFKVVSILVSVGSPLESAHDT
jgi:hypothetical protein